jgi:short subunit dehydrogenase-like uncharacterized protein
MGGSEWMIYGANGYAGGVILEQARTRGLRPVVAGRREEAVRRLAELHDLPFRVFSLDDPAPAAEALHGIGTLLLAAGPFSATSAPAIDACLRAHTNYLDITGEAMVIEAAARRGTEAKKAGVVILPAIGFDVVPSDCLAAELHRALPSATRLTLAIDVVSSPGPGTLKTVLEGAAMGGLIRQHGALTSVPTAFHARRIPFARGDRWGMTIPWGDVSSAFFSTGIPDIEVYLATPWPVIQVVRWTGPLMGTLRNRRLRGALEFAIERWVKGATAAQRAGGRSSIWGRAEDDDGRSIEGSVESLETTTLTACTAVDIAARVHAGEVAPGFMTPSLAFGPSYIASIPETRISHGPVRGLEATAAERRRSEV